jgi:hypothetical protein
LKHYHDLTVYHQKRDLHGLTVVVGWVKDTEEDTWLRALYLMPAGSYGESVNHIYYLIENVDMHQIALDAGRDIGREQFAYDQASAALQMMGLTDSLTMRHLVIGIINDHLDTLILMPPRPEAEQRAAADIVIENHMTGQRHEAVAMEDV